MNIRSPKVQTGINLFTGLFMVVVQFVVGFFMSPFIVKALGAEANGFSLLANNFVMYATLVTIAFNSMAGRFITVAYYQNDLPKAQSYYSSLILVNIVIAALFIPCSILLVTHLENVVNIDNVAVWDVKLLFGCIFANFFLNLFISVYFIVFYVLNKMYYVNIINAFRTLANSILLLVVFSVFPPYIFYVSGISMVLTMIIVPICGHYKKTLLPGMHFSCSMFSFKRIKELFLSGIWNTVNQCGHLLNTGLDVLIANWFISPFYMGMIAISKTIPSAVIQLSNTINSSFSPSITTLWAQGESDKMLRELHISIKISSVLVSIPLVTFCCFCEPFYRLWQPELNATELAIMSILGCLPFILVAGTQTLYNVFTATNNLKVNSITFICMGVLNIAAVVLWLSLSNKWGAYVIVGVSSGLSIIRNLTIIIPYQAHLLKLKWFAFYRSVMETLIICGINVLVSFFLLKVATPKDWTTLVMACFSTAFITLCLDILILFTRQERNLFLKIFIRKSNG